MPFTAATTQLKWLPNISDAPNAFAGGAQELHSWRNVASKRTRGRHYITPRLQGCSISPIAENASRALPQSPFMRCSLTGPYPPPVEGCGAAASARLETGRPEILAVGHPDPKPTPMPITPNVLSPWRRLPLRPPATGRWRSNMVLGRVFREPQPTACSITQLPSGAGLFPAAWREVGALDAQRRRCGCGGPRRMHSLLCHPTVEVLGKLCLMAGASSLCGLPSS